MEVPHLWMLIKAHSNEEHVSLANFWFIANTPVQYEILAGGVRTTDV